jgi:hypothetical protein
MENIGRYMVTVEGLATSHFYTDDQELAERWYTTFRKVFRGAANVWIDDTLLILDAPGDAFIIASAQRVSAAEMIAEDGEDVFETAYEHAKIVYDWEYT